MSKNFTTCLLVFFILMITGKEVFSQFPPPAGYPGTTAIYKDSSIIIGWARSCEVNRGYIDISDTSKTFNGSNKASYGNVFMTIDTADNFVLSLGDGGTAILEFDAPIGNGPGFDFAVFENSFSDDFLELAFVEVSSDGNRFVRFPAVSLTPEYPQTSTFGITDATKIHNFAGKYRALYGTPFDLEDLKDSTGIDVNHIIQVRFVDVIGCVQTPYATYDSQGHKVNDPWPTPFDTGGFDLDAVAVIHYSAESMIEIADYINVFLYPNPVNDKLIIVTKSSKQIRCSIHDLTGKSLAGFSFCGKSIMDISPYLSGVYIAKFQYPDGYTITKKIIKN